MPYWIAPDLYGLPLGGYGVVPSASLGLVRKAQMLYHRNGKEMSEIAEDLGVSLAKAAYPTHFFSVYDLPIPKEDGDIFEHLMADRLSVSAEEIALGVLKRSGSFTGVRMIPSKNRRTRFPQDLSGAFTSAAQEVKPPA